MLARPLCFASITTQILPRAFQAKPRNTSTIFKRATSSTSLNSLPDPPHRILITSPIPEPALERLQSTPNLHITPPPQKPYTHSQLLTLLTTKPYHALYATLATKITSSIIAAASPTLRIISTMSVGYNHIDINACKEHGIMVGNTPDVLTESTADIVVMLMLMACRRGGEGIRKVKDGEWGGWTVNWMCGRDLWGATVGIVGLGRIGRAVVERLRGFGCKVLCCSVRGRKGGSGSDGDGVVVRKSFEKVVGEADFIVPLCPLSDETRGLFDKSVFARMKTTAVFVNAARGEIVNQDDLYWALKNRSIFAAGLDVTSPEPLPTDSPLLELDNCVVLPHIGSATLATRNKMGLLAADNLINACQGKPMMAPVL